MASNNAFAAGTCIVGVVITNESNMASHFPEARNLHGSNADMFSDVAGPSSSGSGDLFELSGLDRSNKNNPKSLNKVMHYWPPCLDLSVTTAPILPFRACYVILHIKFYSLQSWL